jgi:glycosyltransferase involved in cell wall biosynthesis
MSVRIAFDHQAFRLQSYGGVSRYFVRLARELNAAGHRATVHAPLHCNRYLRELPAGTVTGLELRRYPPRSERLVTWYNQRRARASIRGWGPSVVHETYFSPRTLAPDGCPTVVTVFDMIHELFDGGNPAWDATREAKRLAVGRAAHVLCISGNTRRDVIRILGIPEERVTAVHLGVEPLPTGGRTAAQRAGPEPYLLYVGSRRGYKNFRGLVAAVAASPRLRFDFVVIAFGGGQLSPDETRVIREAGLDPDRVRQVSGGDEVLGALYAGARALVYPSLYEGFGLPPLEAMVHDCPVVSSRASAMPEVIGAAGECFDPSSTEEMAAAIERVVYSEARTAELRRLGRDRAAGFTWRECAARTADVYRQVTGRAPAGEAVAR